MDIAYAAHTESCTFMLDSDGVCRWVVASSPRVPHKARHWEKSQQAAARCIGAQYVASLDVATQGGLIEMPRVGVPLLFARVEQTTGRITLVRTGPLVRFEVRGQAAENPDAYDSGMRERPQDRDTLLDDHEPLVEEEWEDETRRMRRDDDPRYRAPAANEDVWAPSAAPTVRPAKGRAQQLQEQLAQQWETDTETSRFEMDPSTLEQMRPTGTSDWAERRRSSPPATPGRYASYATQIPRAAPVPRDSRSHAHRFVPPAQPYAPQPVAHPARPRQSSLPPAPTNQRPTIPPPAPNRRYVSPPYVPQSPRVVTPLPPPPGYPQHHGPVTPPPAPPRRSHDSPLWSDRAEVSLRRAR